MNLLQAFRDQGNNDAVVLAVHDTGPGVPSSVCNVFLRDSAKGRGGGLPAGGLGLAIVSEIMQIHAGSLEIDLEPGGGTCVSLVWPHPES